MGEKTNEAVLKALKKLRKDVSKKLRIETMILFGSRARGDYLLTSDVDLIIISDDFAGTPFRKRPTAILEHWNIDVDLEAFCYTHGEYEQKKKELGIIRAAAEEGREIAAA